MAKKPKVELGTLLLNDIRLRPFCDHNDVDHLTPEQQAAVHAFLHEFLASFYRMSIIVPEGDFLQVLNSRFSKALKAKK